MKKLWFSFFPVILAYLLFLSAAPLAAQQNGSVGTFFEGSQAIVVPEGILVFGLPSGNRYLVTDDGVSLLDDVDAEAEAMFDARTREQIEEEDPQALQRLQESIGRALMTLIAALEAEQEGISQEDVDVVFQIGVLLGVGFTDAEEVRIADALDRVAPVDRPGLPAEVAREVDRVLSRTQQAVAGGDPVDDPLLQEEPPAPDEPPAPPPDVDPVGPPPPYFN